MPHTFTHAELTSTITMADLEAMSAEDRFAFDRQWLDLCFRRTTALELHHIEGDYDRIGSLQRFEIGE